jgi:3-methylcrotonyl-CoA carboxylase alpha subunit
VIRKLLVANRGEIACRVITGARAMGIATVAVYSDADRNARHVSMADEARRIGPPAPRESYLDMNAILAAAKETGADAIHPGYGFLSENEDFAAACEAAGIVFVGPSPQAIAAMGDKSAAKSLMGKAGVPLVPGYHGADQDASFLAKEATRIGYPVLIKASAGGGGKGMRIVAKAAEFDKALGGAQREAKSSFGDDRVLLERYLQRPRHIEIQVFGDSHGNVIHLFERDCSVQRRHQKVLEEAPAPGMTPERRKSMGDAAVAAARAIGYSGAGTVEFIAEQDGTFYFMEMNTRLQVEHPVTEMITGIDLVQWQLRVAAGEKLPLAQDEVPLRGHAIEARIYAENADKGFLPSTGTLRRLRTPPAGEFSPLAGALRIDSGVREGDTISPWYDPMIAKLVAWGETREAALAHLSAGLAGYEIIGLTANVEFLGRIVTSRAFASADLDTGLIERSKAELFPAREPASDAILAVAAYAELVLEQRISDERARTSEDPHSPWNGVDGWRLNQGSHHRFVFRESGGSSGETLHEVMVEFRGSAHGLLIGERRYDFSGETLPDGRLLVRLDGRALKAAAQRYGEAWHLFSNGRHWKLELVAELHDAGDATAGGSLAAPMPGKIISVAVKPGEAVAKGAPLMILEAMKMEHTISAPRDGKVEEVYFAAGDQVNEGAELLKLGDA